MPIGPARARRPTPVTRAGRLRAARHRGGAELSIKRGEFSFLRTADMPTSPRVTSGFYPQYHLDSSRVDYELARRLYNNTDDRYKLGAGFSRPVVNKTAEFMGVPRFSHESDAVTTFLQETIERWAPTLLRINRNALRDGDCYARIDRVAAPFGIGKDCFEVALIPPEWVYVEFDPFTGAKRLVRIEMPAEEVDENGVLVQYSIFETFTPTARAITVSENAPAAARARQFTQSNPWNFIPVVHFKNEAEENQKYGVSDLECIEPLMRAYHDTMLFAVQGSKMFSRPKVSISVKDPGRFLEANFSQEELEEGRLTFIDKEIFIMQDTDKAAFITAESGLPSIMTLLKFLYYCIVDTSETPEYVFGTAIQASKASVSEQNIPFGRKIRYKREMFEAPYRELMQMTTAMWAAVESIRLTTLDLAIEWEEINPHSDQENATTFKTWTEGFATAVGAGLCSPESASDALRVLAPSILPWTDPNGEGEVDRIKEQIQVIWELNAAARPSKNPNDPNQEIRPAGQTDVTGGQAPATTAKSAGA